MPLLIRTIFPFQYNIIENTAGSGTNCNNLVNSSVKRLCQRTQFLYFSNGYPKYLFDITLHKFLYNNFIKNKTSDNKEKSNLCFSSVFPDGKEVYNRQKCQLSYFVYPQLLFMQKETDPTVAHQLPSFNSLRLNSSSVAFRGYV